MTDVGFIRKIPDAMIIFCCGVGLYNWNVLLRGLLQKGYRNSIIPAVALVVGYAGIAIGPLLKLLDHWWIPLVADGGEVVMILRLLCWYLAGRLDK